MTLFVVLAVYAFDMHGFGRSEPLDCAERALIWHYEHLVGLAGKPEVLLHKIVNINWLGECMTVRRGSPSSLNWNFSRLAQSYCLNLQRLMLIAAGR